MSMSKVGRNDPCPLKPSTTPFAPPHGSSEARGSPGTPVGDFTSRHGRPRRPPKILRPDPHIHVPDRPLSGRAPGVSRATLPPVRDSLVSASKGGNLTRPALACELLGVALRPPAWQTHMRHERLQSFPSIAIQGKGHSGREGAGQPRRGPPRRRRSRGSSCEIQGERRGGDPVGRGQEAPRYRVGP